MNSGDTVAFVGLMAMRIVLAGKVEEHSLITANIGVASLLERDGVVVINGRGPVCACCTYMKPWLVWNTVYLSGDRCALNRVRP